MTVFLRCETITSAPLLQERSMTCVPSVWTTTRRGTGSGSCRVTMVTMCSHIYTSILAARNCSRLSTLNSCLFHTLAIAQILTNTSFCATLFKKRRYIGITLSVCLSLRLSVHHKNILLAISLPYLNLSSSNIQIMMLMTTQT